MILEIDYNGITVQVEIANFFQQLEQIWRNDPNSGLSRKQQRNILLKYNSHLTKEEANTALDTIGRLVREGIASGNFVWPITTKH